MIISKKIKQEYAKKYSNSCLYMAWSSYNFNRVGIVSEKTSYMIHTQYEDELSFAHLLK